MNSEFKRPISEESSRFPLPMVLIQAFQLFRLDMYESISDACKSGFGAIAIASRKGWFDSIFFRQCLSSIYHDQRFHMHGPPRPSYGDPSFSVTTLAKS